MKKDDLIDFLVLAAQQGASDLHLTPGALPMIRVAGVIKPLTEDAAVLSAEDTRRLVIDALKEGQRAKLENEWQLDFALQVHDLGRYRGNACYVSGAIEANFRQIPAEIPDLKSLGHSPVVDRWCDERAGLVLVTGASGEGKSTTLASMAQTIAKRRSVNMVSIEDPIEFVHSQGRSLVNQREVGSDVHRLRFSAQERVETGCGRHSCWRVAGPGHDPNCDYGGGNGAPCDWNHAHQRRANRHRANY